jgi:hypothetical protein
MELVPWLLNKTQAKPVSCHVDTVTILLSTTSTCNNLSWEENTEIEGNVPWQPKKIKSLQKNQMIQLIIKSSEWNQIVQVVLNLL